MRIQSPEKLSDLLEATQLLAKLELERRSSVSYCGNLLRSHRTLTYSPILPISIPLTLTLHYQHLTHYSVYLHIHVCVFMYTYIYYLFILSRMLTKGFVLVHCYIAASRTVLAHSGCWMNGWLRCWIMRICRHLELPFNPGCNWDKRIPILVIEDWGGSVVSERSGFKSWLCHF